MCWAGGAEQGAGRVQGGPQGGRLRPPGARPGGSRDWPRTGWMLCSVAAALPPRGHGEAVLEAGAPLGLWPPGDLPWAEDLLLLQVSADGDRQSRPGSRWKEPLGGRPAFLLWGRGSWRSYQLGPLARCRHTASACRLLVSQRPTLLSSRQGLSLDPPAAFAPTIPTCQ